MRKLVVSNMMSLDGFVGHTDDSVGQLPIGPHDDSFHRMNLERLERASTILAGWKSYEAFEGYWPPIEDDSSQPELYRRVSHFNNAHSKVVISDTYEVAPTSAWLDSTTVIARHDAEKYVTDLKHDDGKDILVFGSPTTWNHLLSLGLVDDIYLMIAPVVLGEGIRAFGVGLPHALSLQSVEPCISKPERIKVHYSIPAS